MLLLNVLDNYKRPRGMMWGTRSQLMYGLELQKTAKKLPPSVSKGELVMSREGIRVYLLTEFVQFFDNLIKAGEH